MGLFLTLKVFSFIFRVCPSTKIDFKKAKQYNNKEMFSIDDGCITLDLASKGNILVIDLCVEVVL